MIKDLFKRFDRLVLLRQTLFGLPWLISTAILASLYSGKIPTAKTLMAVGGAFATARFAGMCFNRYLDRFIDAKNPRTCNRSIPKGEISPFFCLGKAVFFLFLFALLSMYLQIVSVSVCAAILLVLYSLTKRFTTLCHVVLGFIQAFGPVLTWIVVTGEHQMAGFLLGLALCCTITASDMTYACQDVPFDRKEGLYSFPAKYGIEKALRYSYFLYFIGFSSLFAVGVLLQLHLAYFLSIFFMGGCFFVSRKIVDFDTRFRFCNLASAFILLAGVLGELIWHALL